MPGGEGTSFGGCLRKVLLPVAARPDHKVVGQPLLSLVHQSIVGGDAVVRSGFRRCPGGGVRISRIGAVEVGLQRVSGNALAGEESKWSGKSGMASCQGNFPDGDYCQRTHSPVWLSPGRVATHTVASQLVYPVRRSDCG